MLLRSGNIMPKTYDAVIISHVLEHIFNIQGEMAAMASVLKPNGKLFIEVPNWSGNAALPMDDDATHLHSFSVNSLARLMADHGLRAASVRTERIIIAAHWEVIRVIGIPFAIPKIERFLGTGEQFIVWGAGNRAKSVLGNFFPMTDVMFFVDSDKAKQGSEFLGRPVKHPAELADHPAVPVLVAAIEAEESIRHDMYRLGFRNRTLSLSDLLKAAA
jgi:SAM-dependent methyltransferase